MGEPMQTSLPDSVALNELMALTVPQKLALMGALWDSMDSSEALSMSDSLVEELDRRKAAAERDPSSLVPWETIKHRLGLTNG